MVTCEVSDCSKRKPWRECLFSQYKCCLLLSTSRGEFYTRGTNDWTSYGVCVVDVGFCRVEARQWTPVPGTSEKAFCYPNSQMVHIKCTRCPTHQPSFPLSQLLCEWQKHVLGGFSKSRHPGHPGRQDQRSSGGNEQRGYVWAWTQRCRVFKSTPFSCFRRWIGCLLGSQCGWERPAQPTEEAPWGCRTRLLQDSCEFMCYAVQCLAENDPSNWSSQVTFSFHHSIE